MKIPNTYALVTAVLLVASPVAVQAAHHEHASAAKSSSAAPAGKLVPVTEKDAEWLAKARETYPLKQCVISGEELDGMGGPAAYRYRVEGQPDRLVLFCCDGCEEDFLKDPASNLAKIDQGSADKKAPEAAKKDHARHSHH